MLRHATVIASSLLALTSCASVLQIYPEADTEHVQDQAAIQRAEYMVRALLPTEERLKLEGEVKRNAASLFPDYAGVATRMSLFGVADTSTVGGLTEAGVAVGLRAAGALIDALGPDGSTWVYSGFFIPSEVDGEPVDTAEKAHEYAKRTLLDRFRQFVQQEETLHLKCEANCESAKPVFTIQGIRDKEGKNHPLWVQFIFDTPFPAADNPLRDAVLGFKPKWNGNAVLLTAESVNLDEHGRVRIAKNGVVEGMYRPSLYSPVGHRMLRYLTKPGDFVYGINFGYSHIAAINGRLFHIYLKRADSFIDYEWR